MRELQFMPAMIITSFFGTVINAGMDHIRIESADDVKPNMALVEALQTAGVTEISIADNRYGSNRSLNDTDFRMVLGEGLMPLYQAGIKIRAAVFAESEGSTRCLQYMAGQATHINLEQPANKPNHGMLRYLMAMHSSWPMQPRTVYVGASHDQEDNGGNLDLITTRTAGVNDLHVIYVPMQCYYIGLGR